MELLPVLPPDDAPLDFDILDCMATGPEINIVEDSELHPTDPVAVIELIGADSQVTFYPESQLPYMVVNFKSIERFLTIQVLCVDDSGKRKVIELTNKASFVTVDNEKNICKLPLEVGEGWQYACIELHELLANAFASSYARCKEVTICGSCRVSKIFFEAKKYADIELPEFLRVVPSEPIKA